MTRRTTQTRRRGLVILAVLIVVTMAALVGSAVLLRADAGTHAARGELRRTQTRAAAWSGVQAVMARLAEQRDDLLAGGAPVLPEGWSFSIESPDGDLVFHVLQSDSGLPATSENARLDINVATAEMLANLPGLSETLAERIVSGRPEGGYESVESLTRVDGIDRWTLMDETEVDGLASEATLSESADPTMFSHPLIDLLTVWSFDPNVQGAAAGETLGVRRVLFPGGWWSDSMAQQIGERFGSPGIFGKGGIGVGADAPASMGEFVALLRGASIPVEQWGPLLETITPYDATHRRGLVDMNRAPAAVLATIPGIDDEIARAIVDARERTPLASRGSIAWAVEVGVMTPEALEQAADWLTTRSTQWRVRIEGGYEAPTPDGSDSETTRSLLDRVEYEAVIDISSQRPRLATLREITGLDESLAFSALGRDEREPDDPGIKDDPIGGPGDEAPTPEFRRLRQGPDRHPMFGDDEPLGPPPGDSPDSSGTPDEAGKSSGLSGRTGRWTRGGGS
ncbi:MAG: helix-hairpin-helix domain-containing protein [Phycisphaerales bacterium]